MQDNQLVQKDEVGRAFIEQIRRSEYMIGMTLAPDAEPAAEGMRRKLSSALRLLSDDLYSTKTHFVLELIQNADGNAYMWAHRGPNTCCTLLVARRHAGSATFFL